VTKWKVKLTDDAKADFKRLDGREKALVAKKLMNLERDPCPGPKSCSENSARTFRLIRKRDSIIIEKSRSLRPDSQGSQLVIEEGQEK
jgi:hypothetical protein